MLLPTPHISGRSTAKWDVLSGERQTNKLFDHEIIERMGAEFYRDVFEPAVRTAREPASSDRGFRAQLPFTPADRL